MRVCVCWYTHHIQCLVQQQLSIRGISLHINPILPANPQQFPFKEDTYMYMYIHARSLTPTYIHTYMINMQIIPVQAL